MRESTVEDYLVRQVKKCGGEVRKVRWIGRKNAPDRRIFFPGCALWVEVKAPGEKPTRAQAREHARLRYWGDRVEVIDSKDGVDDLLFSLIGGY